MAGKGQDTPRIPEDRPPANVPEMLSLLEVIFHKIRSPIASIVGYAELLNDPTYRHNEEYLEVCQRVITTQGHQISKFLEDVMTMTRMDTGNYELERQPLKIAALAEEVVQEMREGAGRGIWFDNRAGDVVVDGDALRLREMLVKLIDNAIKFSPEGQAVTVSLRRSNDPRWLEVLVNDRGIGMSEEEQRKLFTRFGRANNPQTRGIPGNGLGLYIVKKLVELHEGSIAITSQPAAGSTFTVSLPITEDPG